MIKQFKDFILLFGVLATLLVVVTLLNAFTGASILNFNTSESNVSLNITTNINETTSNLTNASIENVTITKIEDISNETQNITENITINITENLTINQKPINLTPNITLPLIIKSPKEVKIEQEETVQYQAVIGQPVKWKKTIKLDKKASNIEIELPKDAKVTTVKKIENNVEVDITQEETKPSNLITGAAIIEQTSTTDLVIEQEVEEIEVEYETKAPQLIEESKTSLSKRVTISSETHYENILTFTNIPESEGSIVLYWLKDGVRTNHPITEYKDNDNNGLIDEIYWITPHLSNQTFDINITILNLKSFPDVNGNWTVNFTTNGTANLTITPINDTTYGNTSPDDLQFLELNCNGTILSPTYNGSSVSYKDYSCENTTSQHIAKVLTHGAHTLKFEFGNQTRYAHNVGGQCDATTPCDCGDIINETKTLSNPVDPITTMACAGNGLIINASNIVVDCANNFIRGSNGSIGINFSAGYTNSSIQNCNIEDFSTGVYLDYMSTAHWLHNNTIRFNNLAGVNVTHEANYTNSTNNTVYENRGSGYWISGNHYSSNHDTIFNNTNYAIHAYNTTNISIDSAFANESAIYDGISFQYVNFSDIGDIAARGNNRSGLRLDNSSFGNLLRTGSYEFNGLNTEFGSVEIDGNSSNNTIRFNTIQHNVRGVVIGKGKKSENNTFHNNTLNNNSFAHIIVNNSLNNTFIQTLPQTTILTNSTEAEINFTQNITITSGTPLVDLISLTNNQIHVDSAAESAFNVTANLIFKNITSTNPQPLFDSEDDGTFVICSSPQCVEQGFTGNVFIYSVTHFSNYSSNETPTASTPAPPPTGGGNPSHPNSKPRTPPAPAPPAPPAPAPPAPPAPAPTPKVTKTQINLGNCWNMSGLSSNDLATLGILTTLNCADRIVIPINANVEDNTLKINLGDNAKIDIDFSKRIPVFSMFFGEEGHLESPLRVSTFNWLWLILLILASLLLIKLLKDEGKYLKKPRPTIKLPHFNLKLPHAKIGRPHIHLPEPIRPKHLIEDLKKIENKGISLLLPFFKKIKLPKAHLPRIEIAKPSKELLNEIKEKIILNLKEKHEVPEPVRTRIIPAAPIPKAEDLSLDIKVPVVPAPINEAEEFKFLANKIYQHTKEGNYNKAASDYQALLIVYKKLVHEVGNPKDLYNAVRQMHTILTKAIFMEKQRRLANVR